MTIRQGNDAPERQEDETIDLRDDLPDVDLKSKVVTRRGHVLPVTRQISCAPDQGDEMIILKCVQMWLQACIEHSNALVKRNVAGTVQPSLSETRCSKSLAISLHNFLTGQFGFGVALLQKRLFKGAFQMLDRGCSLIRLIFVDPDPLMIQIVVSYFEVLPWQSFRYVRNSLICFMAEMGSSILGSDHPISVALSQLRKADTFDRAAGKILKVGLDVLETGSCQDHYSAVNLKASLTLVFLKQPQCVLLNTLCRSLRN